MKTYNRPVKGCKIYATSFHQKYKDNDYIGEVTMVDGNIALFKNRAGDNDRLIWRFNDGFNKLYKFGA